MDFHSRKHDIINPFSLTGSLQLTVKTFDMAWQAKTVLQWYAAMAPRLGVVGVQPYLRSILVPLFKITEGSAAKLVQGMVPKYSDCRIVHHSIPCSFLLLIDMHVANVGMDSVLLCSNPSLWCL